MSLDWARALALGHQPRLSVRMDPAALRLAGERARAVGNTVGRWLEEAIPEKIEREGGRE